MLGKSLNQFSVDGWGCVPCLLFGLRPNYGRGNGSNGDQASLVAQRLKRLPPMQETRVRSLGWEDPLEKAMATHSKNLPGEPRTEEPSGLQSRGSQRVRHD